jgi:hypothetical protein
LSFTGLGLGQRHREGGRRDDRKAQPSRTDSDVHGASHPILAKQYDSVVSASVTGAEAARPSLRRAVCQNSLYDRQGYLFDIFALRDGIFSNLALFRINDQGDDDAGQDRALN